MKKEEREGKSEVLVIRIEILTMYANRINKIPHVNQSCFSVVKSPFISYELMNLTNFDLFQFHFR